MSFKTHILGKLIFPFFPLILGHFWLIFLKWSTQNKEQQNFEKSTKNGPKLGKKWKNLLAKFVFNPFFGYQNRNRLTDPPLQ